VVAQGRHPGPVRGAARDVVAEVPPHARSVVDVQVGVAQVAVEQVEQRRALSVARGQARLPARQIQHLRARSLIFRQNITLWPVVLRSSVPAPRLRRDRINRDAVHPEAQFLRLSMDR
jgi:hypothetical protein